MKEQSVGEFLQELSELTEAVVGIKFKSVVFFRGKIIEGKQYLTTERLRRAAKDCQKESKSVWHKLEMTVMVSKPKV